MIYNTLQSYVHCASKTINHVIYNRPHGIVISNYQTPLRLRKFYLKNRSRFRCQLQLKAVSIGPCQSILGYHLDSRQYCYHGLQDRFEDE